MAFFCTERTFSLVIGENCSLQISIHQWRYFPSNYSLIFFSLPPYCIGRQHIYTATRSPFHLRRNKPSHSVRGEIGNRKVHKVYVFFPLTLRHLATNSSLPWLLLGQSSRKGRASPSSRPDASAAHLRAVETHLPQFSDPCCCKLSSWP